MAKPSTKGTQTKKRKTTQKKNQFNRARIDSKSYVRRLGARLGSGLYFEHNLKGQKRAQRGLKAPHFLKKMRDTGFSNQITEPLEL